MKRSLFIMLVFCLALGSNAKLQADDATEAQPKLGKSEFFFDKAIQNYLKGDSQNSIVQLNEALKIDPKNQRAKVFLLKILVERGSRLFVSQQFEKAYVYLSQAYTMDPDNAQVKQMYQLATKQIKPQNSRDQVMLIPDQMKDAMLKQAAEDQTQAQGGAAVTLKPAKGSSQAPMLGAMNGSANAAPMALAAPAEDAGKMASVFAAEYAKNVTAMSQLLASFQQNQVQQISQYMAPLERIQNMYYQSEKDRLNIMNQLDNRFKSVLGDVSFQQRMVIYGFVVGLLMLAVITWGFWLIIGRMRSKREEIIMKYQQEMIKMVREMAALPGGTYGALPGSNAGYAMLPGAGYNAMPGNARMLPGAYPQPGMNQMPNYNPAAMNAPDPAGAQDPVSQLDYIARNGNFKERATAAIRMLNFDLDRSMDLIKEMITHTDPFQRETMAAALGENYHPLTMELLLEGLKDTEIRVAHAAIRSLKKLEKMPEEVVPVEVRAEIQKALKNAEI